MKLNRLLPFAIVLIASTVNAEEPKAFRSQNEITNYAIGVETVRNLRKEGFEVNLELIMKGMQDGLPGGEVKIPEMAIRKTMMDLQSKLRRQQAFAKRAPVADQSSKEVEGAEPVKKQ